MAAGRLARRQVVAASLALAAVACVLAPAVSAADIGPGLLKGLGDTSQVVIVSAPSSRSSHATVRAYERGANGAWRQVVRATPARIGTHGLMPASRRKQNSGTTPAGRFAIVSAFGRKANPGTRLPYRLLDRNDAWTYSPQSPHTYNVFQPVAHSWAGFGDDVERLWQHGRQYDYVAVLDYNLPPGPITARADGVRLAAEPADTSAGGGIFLHVSDGRATAGCIAVDESVMKRILAWLAPQAHPMIVVGTNLR